MVKKEKEGKKLVERKTGCKRKKKVKFIHKGLKLEP